METVTNQMIADALNHDDSLTSDLDNGERITVLGIVLIYTESHEAQNEEVIACLDSQSHNVERKGIKELSYGRWVDTRWEADWEAC